MPVQVIYHIPFINNVPQLEEFEDILSVNEDVHPRVLCDKKVNKFGKELVTFCKAYSLLIANGRTGDDKNVGNFTYYVSPIGNSVIDYVICSNELQNDNIRFCIGERTESPHFPIFFSINSTIIPAVNKNNTETDIKFETNMKYVFNDIKIVQYRESLLGSLTYESVQQMCAKIDNNNTNINEILKDFQNILKTSSNGCLRHKRFNKRSQPKLFDKDCKLLKTEKCKCLKRFRQSRCNEDSET